MMNPRCITRSTRMPMRSDERLAKRIAIEILSRYQVKSILDIGCGDGIVSEYLPQDTVYLGLDITSACIYQQKHDNPKVRYVQPDAIPDLVDREGLWDMILLFDVLEHTREFTKLFEVALKSSKQYVVVSLPNELFILDRFRMLLGQELNAHSLDLLSQPEGFKHQYIVNLNKAKKILSKVAHEYGFNLHEEVVRPLKSKNIMFQPIVSLISRVSSDQLWSQGSIFIFQKHSETSQ